MWIAATVLSSSIENGISEIPSPYNVVKKFLWKFLALIFAALLHIHFYQHMMEA